MVEDMWTLTAQQVYLCKRCGAREMLVTIDELGSHWLCVPCHRRKKASNAVDVPRGSTG